MKQIHKQEKEQFKTLFRQENIDRFEDRFKILEIFLQTERHLTANEIHDLLVENAIHFKPDFIRETLQLMCQFGFALKTRFDHGGARYEHRHIGQHHDHMVCTKCGEIIEFKDDRLENLQSYLASVHGFHMLQHKMEIYGICSKCLKNRIRQMQLSLSKPGERLTITGFTGGAGGRMRLLSMGLRIGDGLEVISNLNQGQVVIAVDAKRYVLGKGLAQKILVERITAKDGTPHKSSAPNTMGAMPMNKMLEGQRGIITRVGGDKALRRRLLEMGFLTGSEIYIEKYAPLKDPLELIIKGYHMSLRVQEATHIMVKDVS